MSFKTKPFPHQLDIWQRTKSLANRAFFMEMGTGKTKVALDTAADLYDTGEITGLLVLAPNGVHRNWDVDEIPKHLWVENYSSHLWMTSKASTKWHAKSFEETLAHDGLGILCMSYDAMLTERGAKAAKKFLEKRRCLYVLDESPRIKTPGSKRTKRILASSKYAPYRRILTGTPVDDKPFDVFAQLKFLDPDIWKSIGCGNYAAFKAHFGVWERRFGGGREFPHLVEYRNMKQLQEIVDSIGDRVRKEDVLDLPPKLYSKRYFDLTPEQNRVYQEIRHEALTILQDGSLIETPLAITKMLRLQQVTSGYLPNEDETQLLPIGKKNPRLDLLMEILTECPTQVIVWAKYRNDITQILDACAQAQVTAVRYDGACDEDEMGDAIDAFKAGKAKAFVANPAKGGEGITLTCGKTMVYYNNGYKLSHRLQSEDRAHRIGQDSSVHIIDICASGTIDELIIDSLRKKEELAASIQGDDIKNWI